MIRLPLIRMFYPNPSTISKVKLQNTTTCAVDRRLSESSHGRMHYIVLCKILPYLNPIQPGMIWTVNYLGGGGLCDPPCVSR